MKEIQMRRKFKKYFIPHKENDHRPHILRFKAVGVMLVIVLLVEMLFLFEATVLLRQARFLALIFPSVVTDNTNIARASNALPPLKANAILEAAAQLKANDMATKGYFAHTSPEGITPWYWFGQVGYEYTVAGENLAVNFTDSKDVVDAWMNSPGHRANILNDEFTEIGIATSEGIYKGQKATFVVELFGKPAKAPIGSAPKAQAETQPTIPKPPTKVSPTPAPKQDMFVAIETPKETVTSSAPATTESKDTEVSQESNAAQRVLSQPRTVSNYFYVVMGLFVALALVLKIFIKIRIQHPMLIANGVFLLMIILGAVYFNDYIALHQAFIF